MWQYQPVVVGGVVVAFVVVQFLVVVELTVACPFHHVSIVVNGLITMGTDEKTTVNSTTTRN